MTHSLASITNSLEKGAEHIFRVGPTAKEREREKAERKISTKSFLSVMYTNNEHHCLRPYGAGKIVYIFVYVPHYLKSYILH